VDIRRGARRFRGHDVRLHYLVWHVNVSLIVVILTTALIAVFLDEVGGLIWRRRRRARLGRHHELAQLRTQQHPPEEAQVAPEPDAATTEISPSIQRGT
jgi:lipopolysaccharide/colanic/teichoic acid biosynthesis glycosyltransferase